ncbi:MAG: HEPN domain-containing protein [Ignavibacteria bacterium]|nr:HEPN domain-containing protein [Ignavibacteria bacterium]
MPNELYKDWVRKAEGDYRTAVRESKVKRQPNYDGVCYHSQQCVEKYLKAFRVFSGLPFKRTHALIPLLEDCIELDKSFELIRTKCDDITGIDQFRYPGDFAVKEDAELALNSARVIRKFVRNKLGLNKRERKRRK